MCSGLATHPLTAILLIWPNCYEKEMGTSGCTIKCHHPIYLFIFLLNCYQKFAFHFSSQDKGRFGTWKSGKHFRNYSIVRPKAWFILTLQAFFHHFLACAFSFCLTSKMKTRMWESSEKNACVMNPALSWMYAHPIDLPLLNLHWNHM